ncbi:MAG: hypothetical protein ABF743_13690 [Schleiferilactobacillus perolens]|uniref:hypothetical protein n=1 Tax=Schleiferilactobacillus perolens TaxID=100468 RepID=UPI0039E9F553|nr:hypothetical protein [Schleiferilactobacillus harbinensis]MCI1912754.1 hypothetical protein [Schleiferilactobacillus harbinensis]
MMKEEMVWRNKSYASNVQFVLQIASSRLIFLAVGFILSLAVYLSGKEWYGPSTAMWVLTYLIVASLVCIVGQSLTVARMNQALQLFCFSVSFGILGGLLISEGIIDGPFSKPIPFPLYIGSFFVWPVIAGVVFVVMYRKMLRGDFMKRAPTTKAKRVVSLSKVFMGILVILIGGTSLFVRTAERTQGGKSTIWLMGMIGGIGFAGMSGGLIIMALAKAKFPDFNVKIPSRQEFREARRESAAADKAFKQRRQDGVFFQVKGVNPSKSRDFLQTSRQHISKWLKNR